MAAAALLRPALLGLALLVVPSIGLNDDGCVHTDRSWCDGYVVGAGAACLTNDRAAAVQAEYYAKQPPLLQAASTGRPSYLNSAPPAVNHTHVCLLTERNATEFCMPHFSAGVCTARGKLCVCPGGGPPNKATPRCPEEVCTGPGAAPQGELFAYSNLGTNPFHFSYVFLPALVSTAYYKLGPGPPLQLPTIRVGNAWNAGMVDAFNASSVWQQPTRGAASDAPVCYEKATFVRPRSFTDATMLPGRQVATWFRTQMFEHCRLAPPPRAAHPYGTIVVADRPASTRRRMCNSGDLAHAIRVAFPGARVVEEAWGSGSACSQIRQAVEGDAIVGIHGAQLMRLIFAREGAVIVEVLPYLYNVLFFPQMTATMGLGMRHHASFGLPHKDMSLAKMWATCKNGSAIACMNSRVCYNHARAMTFAVANVSDIVWRLQQRSLEGALEQGGDGGDGGAAPVDDARRR